MNLLKKLIGIALTTLPTIVAGCTERDQETEFLESISSPAEISDETTEPAGGADTPIADAAPSQDVREVAYPSDFPRTIEEELEYQFRADSVNSSRIVVGQIVSSTQALGTSPGGSTETMQKLEISWDSSLKGPTPAESIFEAYLTLTRRQHPEGTRGVFYLYDNTDGTQFIQDIRTYSSQSELETIESKTAGYLQ